jgi:hypothetical protein
LARPGESVVRRFVGAALAVFLGLRAFFGALLAAFRGALLAVLPGALRAAAFFGALVERFLAAFFGALVDARLAAGLLLVFLVAIASPQTSTLS